MCSLAFAAPAEQRGSGGRAGTRRIPRRRRLARRLCSTATDAGLSPRQFTLEPGARRRDDRRAVGLQAACERRLRSAGRGARSARRAAAPVTRTPGWRTTPGSSAVALDALDRIASFRLHSPARQPAARRSGGPSAADQRPTVREVRPLHRKRVRCRSDARRRTASDAATAKHHQTCSSWSTALRRCARLVPARIRRRVYVAPTSGGGFGAQVGMHLAAGQLLLRTSRANARARAEHRLSAHQ